MTPDVYVNTAAARTVPDAGFGPVSRRPQAFHASLDAYAPTPLHLSTALAELAGVGTVLVKDEAQRLGLPSFKVLGASWAAAQAAHAAWGGDADTPDTLDALRAAIGDRSGCGLVAATDGNHGRGVARMARLLGLDAHILVPTGTTEARIDGIRVEGARVSVVDGTYDDAIAASAELADDDHLVVSDTSWPGYQDIPRAVVDGYSTLFLEVGDAVAERGLPTPDVVVLQAGVGAFAAAGVRHFAGADPRPTIIVVEPSTANCLMASARAGGITTVPGPHPSAMAGLNCGRPSELVWPLLAAGVDAFVAIDDEHANAAMRAFAGDGVEAGESGAAGLGGLLALSDDDRARIGLRPDSCVLLVNTEGATDPATYAAVVGTGAASHH